MARGASHAISISKLAVTNYLASFLSTDWLLAVRYGWHICVLLIWVCVCVILDVDNRPIKRQMTTLPAPYTHLLTPSLCGLFHILMVQVFNRPRIASHRVSYYALELNALCYRVPLPGRWLPCGLAFLLHLPHLLLFFHPTMNASIGISCRMRYILSTQPPPTRAPISGLSTWIYCLKVRWKYLIGSQTEWTKWERER